MNPDFAGELYSYDDAQRRHPEAWKTITVSGPRGDGTNWSREERHCVAPQGLGRFERFNKTWVYVEPNGYARLVSLNYDKPEPPPLPRPAAQWKRCGCGTDHNCSACGQPYWLEFHGVADGHCTYCYHAG